MSIEHHILQFQKNKRRRFVMDIIFVILFILAIMGIFVAYNRQSREDARIFAEKNTAISEERARSRQLLIDQQKLERELMESRLRELSNQNIPTIDAPLLSPEASDESSTIDMSLQYSSTSMEVASGTNNGIQGFVQFVDVTTTRIENKRLGFVMEIPEDWRLAFERSDSVAYANSSFYFGVTVNEIARREGAMWIRIIRPCSSMEATTTVFQFALNEDTGVSIREATACIAPFLVSVGYRADESGRLEFERFLLSVARTLYPIVSPAPPYSSVP